jgi:hypothetical protein
VGAGSLSKYVIGECIVSICSKSGKHMCAIQAFIRAGERIAVSRYREFKQTSAGL